MPVCFLFNRCTQFANNADADDTAAADRMYCVMISCGKVVSFFFLCGCRYDCAVCAGCGGVVLAVNMTRKAVHGRNDMNQQ